MCNSVTSRLIDQLAGSNAGVGPILTNSLRATPPARRDLRHMGTFIPRTYSYDMHSSIGCEPLDRAPDEEI